MAKGSGRKGNVAKGLGLFIIADVRQVHVYIYIVIYNIKPENYGTGPEKTFSFHEE